MGGGINGLCNRSGDLLRLVMASGDPSKFVNMRGLSLVEGAGEQHPNPFYTCERARGLGGFQTLRQKVPKSQARLSDEVIERSGGQPQGRFTLVAWRVPRVTEHRSQIRPF